MIVCWSFGAFSLVVNAILKKLPMQFFYHIANIIDLEGDKENAWSQKINSTYNNAQEQYKRRLSSVVDGPVGVFSEKELSNINQRNEEEVLDNDLDLQEE